MSVAEAAVTQGQSPDSPLSSRADSSVEIIAAC